MAKELNKEDLEKTSGGYSASYVTIIQPYKADNTKAGNEINCGTFTDGNNSREDAKQKARDLFRRYPAIQYFSYITKKDGMKVDEGTFTR